MNLKGAKPGRYKPKCAKCGQQFRLLIPENADAAPIVQELEGSGSKAVQDTSSKQTRPDPSPPSSKSIPSAETMPSAKASLADRTLPALEETIGVPAPPSSAPNPSNATVSAFDATIEPTSRVDHGRTEAGRVDQTVVLQTRAAASEEPATASSRDGIRVGSVVGGYKILGELGRGAMGAVYLAQQLSLDRKVAMKVIQQQFAANPVFVARFTREAYAAAQLTHHNVVQIYDLGVDGDINFFSMELVDGKSLADLVQAHKKLDVEAAVGYILQAARGLEFAHNQGMVHRDVKPANLLINRDGVVKVADLGLVKTPEMANALDDAEMAGAASPSHDLASSTANVTMANIAIGTPAFMAPEQAENATGVDHRADIYSLGCTLYVLLTGQAPFAGASVMEVITKHKTEPMVRPDAIVDRIPDQLSNIVMKMVAKTPDERYTTLGDAIKDLEKLLGVQGSGPLNPTEEEAELLESCVSQYNGAAMAKLRSFIPLSFFAVLTMLALVTLCVPQFSACFVMIGVFATVAYFVVGGLRQRTILFEKAREFVWNSRISEWLIWSGALLLFLIALWPLGLIFSFAIALVLGTASGLVFHFVVDQTLAKQRTQPVAEIEKMLRRMRLRGADEDSLRQFVAKYGGNQWEEFFEQLFGYEAKIAVREKRTRTEQGRRGKRFRAWRDPIIHRINEKTRADREAREKRHLQNVEEHNLKAKGVSAEDARQQAEQMAGAIVDEAAEARVAASAADAKNLDPKVAAAQKRARIKAMLADARSGKYAKKKRMSAALFVPLQLVFGAKTRFLLGGLLVAGCLLWMNQNGIDPRATFQEVVDGGQAKLETSGLLLSDPNKALHVPLVGGLFYSIVPGIAGILLMVFSLFRGWKMSLFALPAAAVMCFDVVPRIPVIDIHLVGSVLVGSAIAAVGLFFGRSR